MVVENKEELEPSNSEVEELNIYAEARRAYDLFTEWARVFIKKQPSTPSPKYIRQKFEEYLTENNIDRYGDPLPSSISSS